MCSWKGLGVLNKVIFEDDPPLLAAERPLSFALKECPFSLSCGLEGLHLRMTRAFLLGLFQVLQSPLRNGIVAVGCPLWWRKG